jgi:hypothetical protein
MNSHYFCGVVLEEARRAVTAIIKKCGIEEVMTHMGLVKFIISRGPPRD